jgi:photosystem II stability/assembly factor-like uncharacterized protein
MRRSLAVVTLVAACLAVAGLAAGAAAARAAAPPHAAAPASWTYALYVNADNDLQYAWPRFTVPALRQIPANDELNVVAMVDLHSTKGTRLLQFSGGKTTTVATFPEKDFGSGATLEWFIKQVHMRFPSDHLAVSVWDHGYGWHYFSWDDTSDDAITMPEMRTAIGGAGVPLDVLAFDACNMADIGAAYEAAKTGLVDYLVASEETIDQDGFPYGAMLEALADDPGVGAGTLATAMVDGWTRYYRPLRSFNWCSLGAIDVAKVGAAEPIAASWVAALRADLPLYRDVYRDIMNHTIYGWESWQLDLGAFASHLTADPRITDPALKLASADLAGAVSGTVLALTSGSYAREFSGLTLWWGEGSEWPKYGKAYGRQVAFGKDTGWYGFLKQWNAMRTPQSWPDPKLDRAKYGLTDVAFADADHGWAIGYNNVNNQSIILRTTDGGAHWTTRSLPAWYNYEFASVKALDASHLWTAGSEGSPDSVILGSANGGSSWSRQTSHTKQYLLSVDFVSPSDGWIAGTTGTLLHTTDGGAHWSRVKTVGTADDLWSVDFSDALNGWIAGGSVVTGDGFIRRTSDGGASWQVQTSTAGAELFSVAAPIAGSPGYAVGGAAIGGQGVVLTSADGGSWDTRAEHQSEWFCDVAATGGLGAWLVGEQGTVMQTTDGGGLWTSFDLGTTSDLTAASFTSPLDGWVVGDCEQLFHTSNGGGSWSSVVADVTGPVTHLRPATLRYRGATTLRYRVDDDLSATATVRITFTRVASRQGGRLVGIKPVRVGALKLGPQSTGVPIERSFAAHWRPGRYVMRCLAIDEAGNPQSHAAKATLTIR